MTDNRGRRRSIPGDPTAELTSDPVATGDDVVDRDNRGEAPRRRDDPRREAPRRYDQPVDRDPVHPSNGATAKVQT
jgi:hypothetical protein